MPHRARRTGSALSVAATATLCIFWSIPVAFISSLTEVNSLKKTLPGLGNFIEEHPWVEPIMALIAPLMLLLLNETVLPFILKYVKRRETFSRATMVMRATRISLLLNFPDSSQRGRGTFRLPCLKHRSSSSSERSWYVASLLSVTFFLSHTS
jgi:Calcium-dependent channel, 7TM region, putative phosphate